METMFGAGTLLALLVPLVTGCYETYTVKEQIEAASGSGNQNIAKATRHCLEDFQEEFRSSGDVEIVEAAVTACFTIDDPTALYDEATGLPVLFEHDESLYPDIEIAYICLADCRSSGFLIPRYKDTTAKECRTYLRTISYETLDGRYLGCVHIDLAWLLPFGI